MSSNQTKKVKIKSNIDRILIVVATGIIVATWILGILREETDIAPYLQKSLPAASLIEYDKNNTYKAYASDDSLLGYITLTSASGYGGPLKTATAVNLEGRIVGLSIVNDKETPSYISKVKNGNLQTDLIGKSFQDNFILGEDIDGVSGATFSSRALNGSAKKGVRFVSQKYLGYKIPKDETFSIDFGMIEITLILLFAIGYFAHRKTFKYKSVARWATMICGLLILGFYYNQQLTLSHVSQLLLGYFPDFQTHLYWYLLLGGIFFVFTVDNKNPYCHWFCPFGAAQECLGAIGAAKVRSTGKYTNLLVWMQRIIALAAILLALYFRNPGISSFEVFGTLFNLTGSNFQFAVLGIILISSLFIKRPWCKYLCPLKPTTDAYSSLRRWIIELWKKRKTKIIV
jgi:Na+-translocating ferredoxin:NAD+ oxidoreductase RnfG subunit